MNNISMIINHCGPSLRLLEKTIDPAIHHSIIFSALETASQMLKLNNGNRPILFQDGLKDVVEPISDEFFNPSTSSDRKTELYLAYCPELILALTNQVVDDAIELGLIVEPDDDEDPEEGNEEANGEDDDESTASDETEPETEVIEEQTFLSPKDKLAEDVNALITDLSKEIYEDSFNKDKANVLGRINVSTYDELVWTSTKSGDLIIKLKSSELKPDSYFNKDSAGNLIGYHVSSLNTPLDLKVLSNKHPLFLSNNPFEWFPNHLVAEEVSKFKIYQVTINKDVKLDFTNDKKEFSKLHDTKSIKGEAEYENFLSSAGKKLLDEGSNGRILIDGIELTECILLNPVDVVIDIKEVGEVGRF